MFQHSKTRKDYVVQAHICFVTALKKDGLKRKIKAVSSSLDKMPLRHLILKSYEKGSNLWSSYSGLGLHRNSRLNLECACRLTISHKERIVAFKVVYFNL